MRILPVKHEIERILKEIENASVGALEFSRIAFTKLYNNHLHADGFVGTVITPDGNIEGHYWLECFGYIIDYRLCATDNNAPFGVFKKDDHVSYNYDGLKIKISPLSDHVLEFLTAKTPLGAHI